MNLFLRRLFKRISKDRSGQSMAFIAIILFTLVCFIAITIDVGVFVSHKIHTQGIADAAAVSGAVWQARGLNIIKLLNQMISVAITHIVAEEAQEVYWDAKCTECIADREWFSFTCFIPPSEPCWVAIVELDDLLNEQDAIKDQIKDINKIQKMIGDTLVPTTAILAIQYANFSMNDNDLMFPYVNFVAGTSLLFPKLALKKKEHNWHFALWSTYDGYILDDAKYPNKQWIATLARYKARPEIMFDKEYDASGTGHWAIAQARPFNDDPNLSWSYWDGLQGCKWDVKLMPFTADNELASQMGSVFSWLISGASDFFILH